MADFNGNFLGTDGSDEPTGNGGNGLTDPLMVITGGINTLTAGSSADGGHGGFSGNGGVGGKGGVGIDLSGGSALTTTDNQIRGGDGGASTSAGGVGGDGGNGVDVSGGSTLTIGYDTEIFGGSGGLGSVADGTGGTGVQIDSGTVNNAGEIEGGDNLAGSTAGSAAGIGVFVSSAGTLNNSGTVYGGYGGISNSGDGDDGGIGVQLAAGGVLTNTGIIGGGYGGVGAGIDPDGDGGIGLQMLSGSTFTNAGAIYGGYAFRSYNGTDGVGGIAAQLIDATLTNEGFIKGGAGGDSYYVAGGTGGAGVDLVGASTLTNDSLIVGGYGGSDTSPGGLGGAGGTGVHVVTGSTLNNLAGAEIFAGAGGFGSNADGAGGTGVQIDGGTVNNAGGIEGGDNNYNSAAGGLAGIGAVVGSAGTLNNSGTVYGGYGGYSDLGGGVGGIGVQLAAGGVLSNTGTIGGGNGGVGNAAEPDGAGGIGLQMLSGSTFTNAGTILGGLAFDSTNGADGAGGAAVQLIDAALTNEGVIAGGDGGDTTIAGGNTGLVGGSGGTGVEGTSGSSLINDASISGGAGGYGYYHGGAGGIGVQLSGAEPAVNNGTISGGAGGSSTYYVGGNGGVGVELVSGGTLTNSGTISGGAAGIGTLSQAGDAVHFGNGDSRLIIETGAVFNGKVVATASYYNVIELTATGAGAISFPQFTGFDHIELDSGAAWDVEGAVGADVTVDLDGVNGTFGIDDAADFQAEISGFDISDVINLENVSLASITGSSFDSVTGELTLSTPGGTLVLDFADPSSFNGLFFTLSADGGVGTDIILSATPCYCPGTLILTERGEVPVESLVIGDRVVTVSGALEPIKWIGRRSYAGRFIAGKKHVLPVRIKAGALAEQSPRRDLVISPLHAMYLDGALIPASELVNGVTIVQLPVATVEYIHIELAAHNVIWAEGAASETFIDDDSRGMFGNAGEYARLYPDAAHEPARYCAPRLTEGYALEAIRQRIAARAVDGTRQAA